MESKSNKSILLIAPLFFNYYKEIMDEAIRMGYSVDYICDAPSNSNLSKAVGRINKKFLISLTKKYFNNEVLPKIEGKSYDFVLVVGGMTFAFTPQMVGELRSRLNTARFIIYQWDSEENLPYATGIHKYFDAIYSFDMYDCESKERYQFLPLFYTRRYEEIGKEEVANFKYDCSYVGTAHPLKYKNINEMAKAVKDKFPRQLIYHYMPSSLKYYYHKLLAPEYKGAKKSDFKWEKVPADKLMEIIKESKCILDSPQAGQTGLTIRTIECLGAKRKLITANVDVKKYDFYRPANVMVFGEYVDPKFFSEPFEEIDNDVYEKYALRNWIGHMLMGD